jgi:hypothetical protein
MNYAGNNNSEWADGINSDNKVQDDLAVITQLANGFGYRPDDHANDKSGASTLTQTGNLFAGQGIIEKADDIDFFRFNGSGKTTISANTLQLDQVTMLDIVLNLYDSTGTLIESANPLNSRDATITKDLTAGTYYIAVSGTGKSNSGQPKNFLYAQGQYTVNVQTTAASNTAPKLAAGGSSTFTKGQAPALIAAGITLTDPDSPNWNGGRITATVSQSGTGEDRLSITPDNVVTLKGNLVLYNGAVVASLNGGAGTSPLQIQFNSDAATLVVAQAVLSRLSFANISANPSLLARSIEITATDQQGAVSTVSRATVNVLGVNDPPTVALNEVLIVGKGATIVVANSILRSTDPQQPPAEITYKLTRLPAAGSLQLDGTTLALTETFTQLDIDSNRLKYIHDGSDNQADGFAFTVSDGQGGLVAETNFNIRLSNGNAPVQVNAKGFTVAPGQEIAITSSILSFSFPPGGAPADAWGGDLMYLTEEPGASPPAVGDFIRKSHGVAIGNWSELTITSNDLIYRAPTADQFATFKKENNGATSTKLVFIVKNAYKNASTAPITITINFTDQNAAPKIGAFVPLLNPAPETVVSSSRNAFDVNEQAENGGTTVAELVDAARISDPEGSANLGIAVTSVDSTHGSWEYTTDGGDTWTSFSDLSAFGTLLLAGDTESAIRFLPDLGYEGTAPISFRAWDGTSGSPGLNDITSPEFDTSSLSVATGQAIERVIPGIQAPSFDGGADVTLNEGTGTVVIPNWASNIQFDTAHGENFYFLVQPDRNVEPGVIPLGFLESPTVSIDGTLRFTVAPGSSGHTHVFVFLTDGVTTSEGSLLNIDVNPVNNTPTLNVGPDLEYRSDSGPVKLVGWASNITAGAPEETNQQVIVQTTNTNPGLFSQQPTIDRTTGSLSFTPARFASGVATVTIKVTDDGKLVDESDVIDGAQGVTTKTFRIAIDAGVPPTANELFLGASVQKLLGRAATDAELATLSATLLAGGRNAAINQILTSDEFYSDRVSKIYQGLIGAAPDATTLSTYIQVLKSGGSLTQVRAAILGLTEYLTIRGGGTNAGFLAALYHDLLGRPIDAFSKARFLRSLNRGTSSRLAVATAILKLPAAMQLQAKADAVEFLGVAPSKAALNSYAKVFKSTSELTLIRTLVISNDFYRHATHRPVTIALRSLHATGKGQ